METLSFSLFIYLLLMNQIQHTDPITGRGSIKFGYGFTIKIVIITKVIGPFLG